MDECEGGEPRVDIEIATLAECAARRGATARAFDRRRRAVHLHFGHDGPAQGGAHHPCARAARHARLLRPPSSPARRTAFICACRCTTPTAASSAPGMALAVGGSVLHSRAIFRERVLERRRARELHAVRLYRRTLPLSRQCAAGPQRSRASHPRLSRQRLAARHFRGLPAALRHRRGAGVLRLDRRQRRDVQSRFAPGRHRAHSVLGRAPFSDEGRRLRRRGQRAKSATPRAIASSARPTRSAS